MTEATLLLTLLYAQQVVSMKSAIEREEQVHSSAEEYVKVAEALKVQKRLIVLEDPKGGPSIQMLPLHILYYLSRHFGEEQLFQKGVNIAAY